MDIYYIKNICVLRKIFNIIDEKIPCHYRDFNSIVSNLRMVKKNDRFYFRLYIFGELFYAGKRFFKHGQLDNRSESANIFSSHVCRTITTDVFRFRYRIKYHAVKHSRCVEFPFPFVPVVPHD